jgi:16S rRNA processing protein RimM
VVDVPEKTLVVGQLAGVFGVKGWLKIRSYTQPDSNIFSYSPWWLKTAQGLKKVEVTDYSARPQGFVVQLKGIDDRDVAAQLGKIEIVISADLLPELASDDYYYHQLIGLKIISIFSESGPILPSSDAVLNEDYSGVLLGCVSDVLETGANDVLVVKPCQGSVDEQERLIPYVREQYVIDISLEKGEIQVDWDPTF